LRATLRISWGEAAARWRAVGKALTTRYLKGGIIMVNKLCLRIIAILVMLALLGGVGRASGIIAEAL